MQIQTNAALIHVDEHNGVMKDMSGAKGHRRLFLVAFFMA